MQALETSKRVTHGTSRRLLLPAAAVLLLGGTVFVAAGGLTLLRSWFLTVAVNGNVVHTGEVVLDENGEATIALPEGALKPGVENEIAVSLEGQPGDTPREQTITITAEGSEQEMIVRVGSQPDPNADE
jgi:hypothetical protein